MRASYYAQAFHDLACLSESARSQATASKMEEGVLVKQFVATVVQNGHAHLLRKILRSIERTVRREEKQSTIEVTSAKELSQEDVGALLKKEPWKYAPSSAHKKVLRKTDGALIGGAVVRTSTTKIDASYKRILLDLYRQITA